MNSRTRRIAYQDPFSLYFLLATLFLPSLAAAVANVRMQTDLGAIDIELFDTVAPQTVANFMNYVNDGDYEGTFFHRSNPGFVVQGGGFIANTPSGSILTDGASLIPIDPAVINEFNLSNVRGTLAMAKLGDDPDSATSQWFFNLDDNSENLDNQNGGFTVFARVLNDGMDVVDSIAALPRCVDVFPFPQLCRSFPDVPFTGADSDNFTNDGVINISYIGSDDEGDGAIDVLEDAAPNNGDGNNDTVLDSMQQYVASFPDESGGYTIIEVTPQTPLQFLNVLGITYARAKFDVSGVTIDRDFANGYFSFDLLNVVPGDNVVTVTLPTGTSPDQFFNFGPTPDNNSPHWYEFSFDGTTGAEIKANVIKLHYADGQRGDSDLVLDGTIKAAVGGAARITGDGDGIDSAIEDGAPNNGDGNHDGIADSTQVNVVSLPDVRDSYVTVEADASHVLRSLSFTEGSSFLGQADPQSSLNGLNFIYGFLSFEVANVDVGGSADIKIILPKGEKPVKFFKFGPTPANPVDHLYEFSFNGETGAEFSDNEVILHFVDGKRGDSDLTKNGIIVDPGTPAIKASNAGASGGGGGGCSLLSGQRHPGNAGGWLLLFVLMALLYLRNRKARFY